MMRRLHGSTAKLVNDLLLERWANFWRDHRGKEFFGGCIRDERQASRTWRYVLTQCRRHGVCDDPDDYVHTRVYLDHELAINRAAQIGAFMQGVPYQRYMT